MALDGIFLSKVCDELRESAVGLRVDRVQQPGRDEVVLVLRGKAAFSAFLSAFAQTVRGYTSRHTQFRTRPFRRCSVCF